VEADELFTVFVRVKQYKLKRNCSFLIDQSIKRKHIHSNGIYYLFHSKYILMMNLSIKKYVFFLFA